jgi:hypothetical protein
LRDCPFNKLRILYISVSDHMATYSDLLYTFISGDITYIATKLYKDSLVAAWSYRLWRLYNHKSVLHTSPELRPGMGPFTGR